MKEPKKTQAHLQDLLDELLNCEDKVSIAEVTASFIDLIEYAENTCAGQRLRKTQPDALDDVLFLTITSFILSTYTRNMSKSDAEAFARKVLAMEENTYNPHEA